MKRGGGGGGVNPIQKLDPRGNGVKGKLPYE